MIIFLIVVFGFFLQIVQILNQDPSSLQVLLVALDIGAFTATQLEFLSEFVYVLRPVMRAIKYVQGRCFFGSYLPMLFGLRSELNSENTLKYCEPLVLALREGFEKRLGHAMDPENPKSVPLFVAMITNPKYKMNYIPQNLLRANILRLKRMLLSAAEEMIERNVRKLSEISTNENEDPEDISDLNGKL